MDRFLDEHESPAMSDRVSLPAADCEVSADDNKSRSHMCTDVKVVLDEGGGFVKARVSNNDSLTLATSDCVAVSSASDLSVGEAAASVDAFVTSCADTAIDLENVNTAAEASLPSADSPVTVASISVDTSKFASLLPSLCPTADKEEFDNSQVEKVESEKVNTADSASSSSVLQTGVNDVDGVATEPSQVAASSSATTVVTTYDQQCFGDDSTHRPTDHKVHDHSNHATAISVTRDAELSSRAELHESDAADVGSAVDEVKPGDVERLLAAVDSATSVAGSIYSNVDPLTAALEFSSANVSVDQLSDKASAESACQQADSVTSGQETDGLVLESSSLPQLSSNLELPLTCSVAYTSTSCLPPDCSDVSSADVLKQGDGSLLCKSLSDTADVSSDAGTDEKTAIDETPVTAIPTNTSEVLAAKQDVLLSDEDVDRNKLCTVDDRVSVSCMNEESTTLDVNSWHDNNQYPKENELASSNLNQLSESCFQSNNTSASLFGPDTSTSQMDGASAIDAASVMTNSDSFSLNLTSGDVKMLDTVGDQPCSLDDAGQSASTDSRSLLPVSSDADHTST